MPACRKLLFWINQKWQLFHLSFVFQTVPIRSSKCSACHTRKEVLKFHKQHGLWENLSLVQCHISLPHYCHSLHPCWKCHMWWANCLQMCKKWSQHPSQHLPISSTCGRHHACQVRWIMHKFYILHKWLFSQLLTHNKMFLLCTSTKALNALNFMKKVVVIHDFIVAVFHDFKTIWFPWFSIHHENE